MSIAYLRNGNSYVLVSVIRYVVFNGG